MKQLNLAVLAALAVSLWGCGNTCDKATNILEDCDGFTSSGDADSECTDADKAVADCVIENKDTVCDDMLDLDSDVWACMADAASAG